MDIELLNATQFIRRLNVGRTEPLLLGAEDLAGNLQEVVTKLQSVHMSASAQIAELVSASLASFLGINVPRAAIVNIPAGFELIVPPSLQAAIQASLGLNFGSIHLGSGFMTFPMHYGLQRQYLSQAAAIFAFDLLVQNPDRRTENPNVWMRSDAVGIFDHEQAFSFLHLPVIGGVKLPWKIGDQADSFAFMKNHVFFSQLRGTNPTLHDFEERLAALSNAVIDMLMQPVPSEWQRSNTLCEQIREYLSEARDNCEHFLNFVRYVLR